MFECKEGFYFNEINLRIGGNAYACKTSGVNLPFLYVQILNGGCISDLKIELTPGTFVNEKLYMEDWQRGDITFSQLWQKIHSAESGIVKYNRDKLPYWAYMTSLFLHLLKSKITMEMIKWKINSL